MSAAADHPSASPDLEGGVGEEQQARQEGGGMKVPVAAEEDHGTHHDEFLDAPMELQSISRRASSAAGGVSSQLLNRGISSGRLGSRSLQNAPNLSIGENSPNDGVLESRTISACDSFSSFAMDPSGTSEGLIMREIIIDRVLQDVLDKVFEQVLRPERVLAQAAKVIAPQIRAMIRRRRYGIQIESSIRLQAAVRCSWRKGFGREVESMRLATRKIQASMRCFRERQQHGLGRSSAIALQARANRLLTTSRTFPLIVEGRKAAFLILCLRARADRDAHFRSIVASQRLQAHIRRVDARRRYLSTKPSAIALQARMRRLIFEYIQMMSERIATQVLETVLQQAFFEIDVRRNPYPALHRNEEAQVQTSMRGWLAALGRGINRYLPTKLSKMAATAQQKSKAASTSGGFVDGDVGVDGAFRFDQSFVPNKSGSKILGFDWKGIVERRRRVVKESSADLQKRQTAALEQYAARSDMTRKKREKESKTSLDLLFRAGQAAPMFRPSGPILPAPLPKREDVGVGSEAWEREKRRRNLLRRRPSLDEMVGTHIPLGELSDVALALIDDPNPPNGRDNENQVKRWVSAGQSCLTFEEIQSKNGDKVMEELKKRKAAKAARKEKAAKIAHEKKEARDLEGEMRALFDSIDADCSGTLSVEELETYLDGLGYGEDEIEEFVMEVDSDFSGCISWEEFKAVAGRFIRQEDPGHQSFHEAEALHKSASNSPVASSQPTASDNRPPPMPGSVLPHVTPPGAHVTPPGAHVPSSRGKVNKAHERAQGKGANVGSGIMPQPSSSNPSGAKTSRIAPKAVDGDAGHQRPRTRQRTGEVAAGGHGVKEKGHKGGRFVRFWGSGFGQRDSKPVDFAQVGKAMPVQMALFRSELASRFKNVAQAYVFFDTGGCGEPLTVAKLDSGIFRMRLESSLSSHQLQMEIGTPGTPIDLFTFCKRLHWGEVALTGADEVEHLFREALLRRDRIMHMGLPSVEEAPYTPSAPKTALSSRQVHRSPGAAASSPVREAESTMRAKRVDNFAKKSAQLSSISSNYGVAGGRSGRQGGGERGWGVLEQCKRTLLSTAVAAGQEDGHIEFARFPSTTHSSETGYAMSLTEAIASGGARGMGGRILRLKMT